MSKSRAKMKLYDTMQVVAFRDLERTEKHTMIYAETIKSDLEALHPKLPAYFCNSGSYVWPLCVEGDVDRFLERNKAKKIDPDGHIDKDVLIAIHKVIKDEKYSKVRLDDILYLSEVLREELKNPNSELSQALSRVYGEVT